MSSDKSDDITAYSLIDRLSVDDDGLISMRFNQMYSSDESYENQSQNPQLNALSLTLKRRNLQLGKSVLMILIFISDNRWHIRA